MPRDYPSASLARRRDRSCLYCMGLNLSNAQIAQELDLNKDDVQAMAACLREGFAEKKTR